MPLQLKNSNATITLQAPITQVGGAVDSVNGMTGDVVIDIPSKTSQLENDSDFATNSALKTEVAGLATKSELEAVEGKIPAHVVEYTQQTLTDEQKKQARENIEAVDTANGLLPVECILPFGFNTTNKTVFVKNGVMLPLDYSTATGDMKTAISRFSLLLNSLNMTPAIIDATVESFATLIKNGIFGDDFYGSYTYPSNVLYIYDSPFSPQTVIRMWSYYSASDSRKGFALRADKANGNTFTRAYNITASEYANNYISYTSIPLAAYASDSGDTPSIRQVEVASAPTTAKQIATKQYVDDGLAQKAPAGDYATKEELAAKQDTLTAGNNITIVDGVISATGGSSGSGIKSIRFRTGKIAEEETSAQFKEWLTYLWNIGDGSYVDLSKCIVTIDGQVMDSVYCQSIGTSQYIYFYPAVLSNFVDNNDKLARYYYMCDYSIAMTKAQDYSYINKSQYATTLLTSDNYTQYISTGGNYTTDSSDSNLYNATQLYICIYNSGGYYAFVDIRPEQNMTLGNCTYRNYSYAIGSTIHSLFYDGNNLIINNDGTDDNIQFIWYK